MKKINFIALILVWLLSSPAFSQSNGENIEKIKAGFAYCDTTLHKLATAIMKGRQSGISKAMMQNMLKGIGPNGNALLGFAYEMPVVAEDSREETVQHFAETARVGCRNSMLQKYK